MRKQKAKANESELKALIKSPDKAGAPKIRRLPTKFFTDLATEDKESGESESSKQPIKERSDTIAAAEAAKLDESHPRFGPLYTVEQEQVDAIKDKAWEHVLIKAPDDKETTTEIYLAAVRKVEGEAKEMYAGKVSGIGSTFRWMMIKDGCFFLQLALLILGCSKQLAYPADDLIFGKQQKRNEVKKWIEAMFYVGNQVPLVVLRELMDQKFFQDVIGKAKWDPPQFGLCKKVLYDVVVLPALRRNQKVHVQACDLLQGAHIVVMGPAVQDNLTVEHGEDDDQIDLEANEDESERILVPITFPDDGEEEEEDETSPGDIGNRIRDFLSAVGLPNAVDNRKRIFPSAVELKRQGIRVKKLENGGARGIHYKSWYFWANLYLPAFPVDGNAELILRNLKNYDNFQQSGLNGREVSSYLRFMSDLIQTTRDAKLLQKRGIIQGKSDDVEKLAQQAEFGRHKIDARTAHSEEPNQRLFQPMDSLQRSYKLGCVSHAPSNSLCVLGLFQTS